MACGMPPHGSATAISMAIATTPEHSAANHVPLIEAIFESRPATPSALEPVAGRNIEPKPTAPMRSPLLLQLLHGATV